MTPVDICDIAFACSSQAVEISAINAVVCVVVSTIRLNVCAVSFAIAVPSSTALIESLMSSVVSLAACATLPARFLTSSATTAKPLPASPALAASTAALSASIFVWNEISSIVLMILAI